MRDETEAKLSISWQGAYDITFWAAPRSAQRVMFTPLQNISWYTVAGTVRQDISSLGALKRIGVALNLNKPPFSLYRLTCYTVRWQIKYNPQLLDHGVNPSYIVPALTIEDFKQTQNETWLKGDNIKSPKSDHIPGREGSWCRQVFSSTILTRQHPSDPECGRGMHADLHIDHAQNVLH